MSTSRTEDEMRTEDDDRVQYGPYELVVSTMFDGTWVIRRQDRDRLRTVAFADDIAGWERFVEALRSGDGEVAAVHAIDCEPSR